MTVPDAPPAAFIGPPTLADVIDTVNTTSRIQQLQTENATLTAQGIPALRANLAIERPRRLRLQAELTQFTGDELDLGSNDQLFWVWVRRNPEGSIYFARHEDYSRSAARAILPVEPNWIIDALGVVELDPNGEHEGPYARDQDRLEIRSRIASPQGELTRVMVVHSRYGWVLEQHLYNARRQLLASSVASQHRFYSDYGVSLPHHVDVQIGRGQPSELVFSIDVDSYSINQLVGEPNRLWAMPQITGSKLVNLADPNLVLPAGSSAYRHPQAFTTDARTARSGYRPVYRGYAERR
jgi:hypothetical protein